MTRNLITFAALIGAMLVSLGSFAQGQKAVDDGLIKAYLAKNHINATRTASGLYYAVTEKGSGPMTKFGKKVSMNYLGKFLDGKKFDANVDENFKATHPFEFVLGTGQVIKGWDEGVALLNVGTRATLYLPSYLGYGERGIGPIPPNSVLVFDVEVVSMDK